MLKHISVFSSGIAATFAVYFRRLKRGTESTVGWSMFFVSCVATPIIIAHEKLIDPAVFTDAGARAAAWVGITIISSAVFAFAVLFAMLVFRFVAEICSDIYIRGLERQKINASRSSKWE